MHMFRFWSSDSRGTTQPAETQKSQADATKRSSANARSHKRQSSGVPAPKRSWDAYDDSDGQSTDDSVVKKARREPASPGALSTPPSEDAADLSDSDRMGRARDIISHQIGLEVLLKHDELRLINQELAKCQVALEQLRRCHLIPYPQHCPTPEQMLDISNGKGPAAITRFGEPVPKWAPPFGVTDGPYARHYAKWLIPDPAFDGVQPEWQLTSEFTQARMSMVEGRTTRNSFTETGPTLKGRPVRGNAGQKLQALSSGYPQTKDKAGPCILKRSDGQTVKLVCVDCERENFSSTQGFINHCRIAHKRDFKSHDEAAMRSGQPIESADVAVSGAASNGNAAGDEKTPTAPPTSAHVHPYARADMSEQDAYTALRTRISDSLKLYHQGKLPGVHSIPSVNGAAKAPAGKKAGKAKFKAATEAPHLSRLLKNRNFKGNLHDLVSDAKTKMTIEDLTPDEESDDVDTPLDASDSGTPVRTPIVKRVPAQGGKTPGTSHGTARPISSKGHTLNSSLVSPPGSTSGALSKRGSDAVLSDEDIDMEDAHLSPTTLVSNNAPSLVSDDGEYDDSDDGSSMSGGSDEVDQESVSDVAEITLDDDHDPRTLRRGSNGVSGAVRLRKHDAKKQVTFLGPVKNAAKPRRARR